MRCGPLFSWITLSAVIASSGSQVGCRKRGEHAAVEPANLQIVSAGNEPRRVLRYRIPKGTSQGLELSVDMNLTAGEMGGQLPTIDMAMLVAVEDVSPSGEMKLRTTIIDATARERTDSKINPVALAGPLERLKGIAIENTLQPNGQVSKGQVEGLKQLPDDSAQQLTALTTTLEQVMMPLPNEPVGPGAVWRTSRDIQQGGMAMTSVNTFSLVSIDGDRLKYTLDTDVHGADQTVRSGSDSVDVKDITGTGGGEGTFSLAALDLTAVLSAEFRSEMAAPGETTPTKMKMMTQTRIVPQGTPPAANGSAAGSRDGSADSAGSASTGSAGSAGSASASGSAGSASAGSAH